MLRLVLPFFLCLTLLSVGTVHAARGKAPAEVRQVAAEVATLAKDIGPTSQIFGLLRQAQPLFDAEVLLPRRHLLECRQGRVLSMLVGFYRSDASYAKIHDQEVDIPLKQGLEMLGLSPEAVQSMEYAWAVDGGVDARVAGARVRQGVQEATLGLQNMNDVRIMVDIFYGMGLEAVYIATRTLLAIAPDAQTGVAMGPALNEVVRCLDVFRQQLQLWAKRPQLVKELGIHRQLNTLDALQSDVEVLLIQPSRPVADRLLKTIAEAREGLTVLCTPVPREEPAKSHVLRLYNRDDLFKPKNFF